MIINKLMVYVSRPLADLMRPYYFYKKKTDLGVKIRANWKVFVARNTSNPTIDEYYEVRVYENVWMHTYNVNLKAQIQFEDKIYEHSHRETCDDCWYSKQREWTKRRRNYYEHVIFEFAAYYDYD